LRGSIPLSINEVLGARGTVLSPINPPKTGLMGEP